jgi:PAS domain S-box-containing protein
MQAETFGDDTATFGRRSEVLRGDKVVPQLDGASRTSARLYLIGAAIYALYPVLVGAKHGYFGTGHDIGTLLMACCLLAIALAMRFVPGFAARLAVMNGIAAYLISGHMLFIAWQRQLDPAAVVAVLMVMAAMVTSLPFTMPSRLVLQGYALLMTLGALVVGILVPEPLVEPRVLLFSVGSLVVVALVSQTAWLRIVGRMQSAERTRRTVVRNAPIALIALDRTGRVRMAEGKGLTSLGLDAARLVGRAYELNDPAMPAVLLPALESTVIEPFEQLLEQDGRTFEASYEPLQDGQRGVIVVVNDITDRAEAEAALVAREKRATHDALHDALTGLPNRELLHDRIGWAIGRLRRRPDEEFAVLFMDLDRFKNINDGLGHMVGDELLMHFARRLKLCIRPSDTLARFGGDEFALLLEDIREPGVRSTGWPSGSATR